MNLFMFKVSDLLVLVSFKFIVLFSMLSEKHLDGFQSRSSETKSRWWTVSTSNKDEILLKDQTTIKAV